MFRSNGFSSSTVSLVLFSISDGKSEVGRSGDFVESGSVDDILFFFCVRGEGFCEERESVKI